jgi:NADPH:quinone reductase
VAQPDGADGVYDTALLHEAVFRAIRDGATMVVVRGWTPAAPRATSACVRCSSADRSSGLTGSEQLRRLASEGRLQLRVAGESPPERAADAHRVMDAGGVRVRAVLVF